MEVTDRGEADVTRCGEEIANHPGMIPGIIPGATGTSVLISRGGTVGRHAGIGAGRFSRGGAGSVYCLPMRDSPAVPVPMTRSGHSRTRRPWWRFLATLVIVLGLGTWAPGTVAQETDEVPAPPDVTAASAFVLDVDANQALYALEPDAEQPPASTTKIATALVVRQQTELTDTVVIEESDLVDTAVFSNMGLVEGDTLTVELLLYGLLLPSGNDAANALARHVGTGLPGGDSDPRAAFIQAMNDLVATLGLEHTQFRNPAGPDEEGHYSSARDLATLAGALLRDATLAAIVDTATYEGVSSGPEARVYPLSTTNDLLLDDGIIGIKTGITEEAGGCLVIGATYSGNRVVTVVLGSDVTTDPDSGFLVSRARYDDTLEIINALNTNYAWVDPAEVPGLTDAMAAWEVTLGDEGANLVIPAGTDDVEFRLRLGPAANPDDEVGRVLFFVGDRQIAERPLVQV